MEHDAPAGAKRPAGRYEDHNRHRKCFCADCQARREREAADSMRTDRMVAGSAG